MDGVSIMKGFTHFISGVALATFSSQVIQMSETQHSLILVLAGIFGILPDSLDFKVARFFSKEDYVISPKPVNMDLQEIADTIAEAIDRAAKENETINVKLNTVKLGADLWQQYLISYTDHEVIVKKGPVVNTGKIIIGEWDPKNVEIAKAKTKAKILHTYDHESYVDIFSGPTFGFKKRKDGLIEAEFLPWHRAWSHSLTLGLFFGIIGFIITWIFSKNIHLATLYGSVIAGGFSIHILEDQLGFMGSNLFWPFTKERKVGLHWMRSSDAWPNFITVWIAVIMIIWNVNRFSSQPAFTTSFVEYLGYVFFLPFTFLITVGFLTNKLLNPQKVNEEEEIFKEISSEEEEDEN
jgi:membrane-bound metal-dependent hydrolase YbcI (DUF457 family)